MGVQHIDGMLAGVWWCVEGGSWITSARCNPRARGGRAVMAAACTAVKACGPRGRLSLPILTAPSCGSGAAPTSGVAYDASHLEVATDLV